MRATRRGNCRSTNEVIGRQAIVVRGRRAHAFFCPNMRYTVAVKLIIMDIMERNRVNSPSLAKYARNLLLHNEMSKLTRTLIERYLK